MNNLNDIEQEFLKILHCDFVGTTKDNKYLSSSGEVFENMGTTTYANLGETQTKFEGKYTTIRFESKNNGYRSISIGRLIKNKEFMYDLSEIMEDDLPRVILVLSDNTEEAFYTVEIIQNTDSKEFLKTTLSNSNDDLLDGNITCDLTSVQGYAVWGEGIRNDFGPLELDSYNYLKILRKIIRTICDDNSDIEEMYIKMVPVFRLVYDKLAMVPEKYLNQYSEILREERERINRNANEEIAKINDERNRQLQENYRMLIKSINYIEDNKPKTR